GDHPVRVSLPTRRSSDLEPDTTKERNILTIAAGSGITPVISIIQSVLENEPKSKAVLIYGNRNVEETIFYQQILALQEKYPDNLDRKSTRLNSSHVKISY